MDKRQSSCRSTAFRAMPTMTVAHLLFAAGMTAYILVAIYYEERDLVEFLPEYGEYRKRVPMLIPRFARKRDEHRAVSVSETTAF